jgi:hypothetical protein
MPGTEMSDDELRQADLSHLAIGEMTPAQRTEIRRRYADFIKRLAKPPAAKPVGSKIPASVKWVPGKKAAR